MIIVNVIILIVFVFLFCISCPYERDFVHSLDEKQHKLKRLYPMGLYLLDHTPLRIIFSKSDKVEDSLKALYVREQIHIVKRLYICNKVVTILFVLILSDLLALGYNIRVDNKSQLMKGNYILRPGNEEGTKTVDLEFQVIEEKSVLLDEDIQLEIEEKVYDKEKLDKLFAYSKEYIDSILLNKNKSSEEVLSDLTLPDSIPNTHLLISWDTGNPEIIDKNGKLHNEGIKESELIWITATITYGERKEEYTRYLRVLPKVYTKEEQTRSNLLNTIESMMEQYKMKDKVVLPNSLGKLSVLWREKTDNTGVMLLVFGMLAAILIYISMDKDLYDKVEKRNREMLLDYPEIINKFTLFVGAGMSVSNAWRKIAKEYIDKGTRKRYAYEEIMITYNELMVGTTEVIAYERFGRRVKLLPYLRFSSLIAQNVKKGSKDILNQLELEATEAFEERKELAKRIGEEAGTKLLVPMMLMLIIVLGIIMVPAFLSFNI